MDSFVMSYIVKSFILEYIWNIEAPGNDTEREKERKRARSPHKILWKFLPLAELALLK